MSAPALPGQPANGSWHSLRQNVHHNHDACLKGKAIGPGDRRQGTGGKPLCERCVLLSQKQR
jgi:hypothetical protein